MKINVCAIIGILVTVFLSPIWANAQQKDDLTNKEQSLVIISSLTATGNLEQLKTELAAGLEAGLTINEVKEALVQLYAYCGFPRSLNAINTFRAVLEERKSNGIQDREGKESVTNSDVANKYERGRKVLEELTKTPQAKPAPGFGDFAPRIDAFLKEHLFADVFDSEVLNYRQRELVTISALASMPGVEAQLNSHINVGKNTGISLEQLNHLADLIQKSVSKTQANTLRKLIDKPQAAILEPELMVRIAEVEIHPEYLKEYVSILKEEAAASVKLEPGVLAIFPMADEQNPAYIRIVEIYADKAAYQSHLKTPHFLHYKTTTLKMVKSLKLIEMESLDKESMSEIFKKIR